MRIGGIASGFDTDQIVKDLMRAERLPLNRMFQQKVRAEWKRDEYRSINTKMLRLRNSAFDLQLQSSYIGRKANSSNENSLTAVATGSSQPGRYQIEVTSLATPATLISAKQDGKGAGERFDNWLTGLSLEEGETVGIQLRSQVPETGADEWVSVEVKAGDTIESFAKQINSNESLGINAYYDSHEDRVVFTTRNTGVSAQIEFDTSEAEGGGISDTTQFLNSVLYSESGDWFKNEQSTNAQLSINGLDTERESNNFELNGTRVQMKAPGSVVLDIVRDVDQAFDNIMAFVELYNETIEGINGKLREPFNRDFPPLTDEEKQGMSEREIELWEEKSKSGVLRGDQMLTSMLTDMRTSLTSNVDGLSGLSSLVQIGIKTGAWHENGKLHVDESKLRSALENNTEEVMALFTNNPERDGGQPGIARRLHTTVNSAIARLADTAGRESSLYDQSALGRQIRGFEERMGGIEERLQRVEDRYWSQFTAMERALGSMHSQSDWLYQQLDALAGGR